jgi:hypothetical protein
MKSIAQALENATQNKTSYFELFGEFYNKNSLLRLIKKAEDMGLTIPASMNELLMAQNQSFDLKFVGTYCEVHAIELPETLDCSVQEYLMNVVFEGETQITFSRAMMEQNNLKMVEITSQHFDGVKPYLFSHYIEYKGFRFYFNETILNGDLALENEQLIILLVHAPKRNSSVVISFPVHTPATLQQYKSICQMQTRYEVAVANAQNSPEVEAIITAVRDDFCSRKRLIICQEAFSHGYNNTSGRRASVEELFIDEHQGYDSYRIQNFTRIVQQYLPNSQLRFLSSKYGIVASNQVIETYANTVSSTYLVKGEKNLKVLGKADVKSWAETVEKQLVALNQEQSFDAIHIFAFRGYQVPLKALHEQADLPPVYFAFDLVTATSVPREIGNILSFIDLVDLIEPYYFSTI